MQYSVRKYIGKIILSTITISNKIYLTGNVLVLYGKKHKNSLSTIKNLINKSLAEIVKITLKFTREDKRNQNS